MLVRVRDRFQHNALSLLEDTGAGVFNRLLQCLVSARRGQRCLVHPQIDLRTSKQRGLAVRDIGRPDRRSYGPTSMCRPLEVAMLRVRTPVETLRTTQNLVRYHEFWRREIRSQGPLLQTAWTEKNTKKAQHRLEKETRLKKQSYRFEGCFLQQCRLL